MSGYSEDASTLPRGIDWIPVDAALAQLREVMPVVKATESIGVADAAGRVLAEPLVAVRDNPPTANSAIDGYGFAHASVGVGGRLQRAGGAAVPGHPFCGTLMAGQALRILTGAVIPDGVDTVVLEEDTTVAGDVLTMTRCPEPGANIRLAGEDIRVGDHLFETGHRIAASDMATLCASGRTQVVVTRRLRVGVLSTGDELIEIGGAARQDGIIDMNRPLLLGMIRQWGHDAIDLGRAPDRRAAVRDWLEQAVAVVDMVLVSGGVSASEQDHVAALLQAEGRYHLWRIAMKPGRPLAMALWRDIPVFGLPGNPIAAFVCALVFAFPALCQLAGERWVEPAAFWVPAAFAKTKKRGRREYLRARLTREGAVEIYPSEGSGLTTGLAWSAGLVELGDDAMTVQPGTPVRYLPYGSFRLSG